MKLFFIAGDARSGTTFIAKQLSDNFGLCIIPETNFIINVIDNYSKTKIESSSELDRVIELTYEPKFYDLGIEREEIEKDITQKLPISLQEYFLSVLTLYTEKQNLSDSTYIGIKKHFSFEYHKMKKYFPESKYICVIRDLRAVFSSQKNSLHSSSNKPMSDDPIKTAIVWKKKAIIIDELTKLYKNDTLVIRYEDFILNLKDSLDQIGSFLGVNKTEDNTLKYKVPERYKKIHDNVNKAPISNRIDAWKSSLDFSYIETCEFVAKDQLERFGYTSITNGYKYLTIFKYFLRYIINILRNRI